MSTTEQLSGELYKSEVLQITSTQLVHFTLFTVSLYTFVFIHATSVVKPVHIFMARSRVFKNCLKAELCFYRYLHCAFSCVPIYIYIHIHAAFQLSQTR